MKNRRPHAVQLWPELQNVLQEHLATWRPILARGYSGAELWLSFNGGGSPALRRYGIYSVIRARTLEAFGEAINPHLLRDIAATAMIEADPSQPRLASDLLQHHSPGAIRDYTEQATSISACRAMHAAIATARANAQAQLLGGTG